MNQMTSVTTPDQHASTFADRTARFTRILAAAGDAWDAPTPCAGWSVRDIVAHVIDTQRDFLAGQGLDAGAVVDLADPLAAWDAHRDHVIAVLGHDSVAEREYDGYFGRTTIGATMSDFYGWDLVVHGSDVARATGQQWSISDDEAQVLHTTADGWGQALYAEGICAAPVEVAQDASATDRLLARLGRNPHWQPTCADASPRPASCRQLHEPFSLFELGSTPPGETARGNTRCLSVTRLDRVLPFALLASTARAADARPSRGVPSDRGIA